MLLRYAVLCTNLISQLLFIIVTIYLYSTNLIIIIRNARMRAISMQSRRHTINP